MLRWDGLPIEEIRRVIDDPAGAAVHDVLTRHRRRLERQRDLLTAQLRDADRFLEEGITMPALPAGSRPSQIKIAVDDVDAAVAFYVKAFGFRLRSRPAHGTVRLLGLHVRHLRPGQTSS